MQFHKDSLFTQELKFKTKPLLASFPRGRFAVPFIVFKAWLLIFANLGCYLSILFLASRFETRFLLDLLFAMLALALGLNVMHEAAHGNFSSRPLVNRIMALSFDFFGVSSDLYRVKHIQFHHNYPNFFGRDGDISETPILRMSPEQAWYPVHRYQAYYFLPLYSLITLTWFYSDLGRLITCKIGTETFKRPSRIVIAKILFFKSINFYLTYILPFQILGWMQASVLILVFHFTLGVVLSLIFQVAHVHPSGFKHLDGELTDWFVHQVLTAADFSCKSRWANFFYGGLNFQVIHHLFPNVTYAAYPKLQLVVAELCKKHKLPYCEFKSFGHATLAHIRYLNELGKVPLK